MSKKNKKSSKIDLEAPLKRNTFDQDEILTVEFNGSMLKKSLRYAVPYRKVLIIVSICMLIMGFLTLVPATLNKFILDYVLEKAGYGPLDWRGILIVIMSVWFGINIVDMLFGYFRPIFMQKVGQGVIGDIRRDTYKTLQSLSFDYYDSRPMGKVLVRVTNYLDDVANIFSSAVLSAMVDSVKIAMIIVWLFVTNWILAIVVLIMVVPMSVLLMVLRKQITKYARHQRNKDSNRTAYIAENIQGTFVTKAFNRTEHNASVYKGLYTDSINNWMKVVRRNEFFYPISDGFFNFGILAVYGVALAIMTKALPFGQGLSIGTLIAFISYMGMFAGPINNIAVVLQQVSTATTNLERVFEITETKPTIVNKDDAYELPTIEGVVKFDNVTFGYDKGTNILENVSVEVPKGSMYALVGPTGAGKTTVVNLISRFYDIQDGQITIDGHDISQVTLKSLRSQVGVMMQDSFIFSGTILDNIRYARPQASEEECIEAAKKVYAHDFIMGLPQGYHTPTLEQGVGLSTGERQLLSFARVVLTDPKILILDEATSSIDTETETQIKKVLDEILVGRTSFVIAHRLSTIRKADKILFIANKGIAEQGSHDELMQQKGLYYNLVTTH